MPSLNVGLDVRNFPSNGAGGYTDVAASNNAIYSYKYSGGSDGNGNATDLDAGVLTITVTVGGDPRYTVNSGGVIFQGDIESQLSAAQGASPTSVVITDSDSQTGSGYYQVTVNDSVANCTVLCDPTITNKPKPPQ